MLFRIVFLMATVPFLELFLFLKGYGFLTKSFSSGEAFAITALEIILTGLLGAMLARRQGLSVIAKMNESVGRGESPAASMIEGALVFVGGALLLAPGYLTDLIGLTLLLPLTRRLYRRWLSRSLKSSVQGGRVFVASWGPGHGEVYRTDETVVEASYRAIETSDERPAD